MISDSEHSAGLEAFEAFGRSLLAADWEQIDGLIRLRSDLKFEDFSGSDFLINTRILLRALDELDGAALTATGNLNRIFVGQMFDRLKLPQMTRDSIKGVCKVINEMDVWVLHLGRIVSECAGLILRTKKRITLSKLGHSLLPDDKAGELFHKIFLAYFRRFDLHYGFHSRDVPAIQQSFPVILWRLDTVAKDWVAVQGIGPKILLPGVHQLLRQAMRTPYDTEEWIICGYVLHPLFELGLIEKKKRSEWPDITDEDTIRTTALWNKFISFAQFGR